MLLDLYTAGLVAPPTGGGGINAIIQGYRGVRLITQGYYAAPAPAGIAYNRIPIGFLHIPF